MAPKTTLIAICTIGPIIGINEKAPEIKPMIRLTPIITRKDKNKTPRNFKALPQFIW